MTNPWEKGDVDQSTVLDVLGATTRALDGTDIPYLFIGGFLSRSTDGPNRSRTST